VTEQQKNDAIQTAQQMTVALTGMQEELAAVRKRGEETAAREKKTRSLTWRGIALVGIDIILSVLLVISYVRTNHNSATVAQLQATNVSTCRASNQTRAQEIALWEHIYALSGINSHTPAKQRKADNALIAYVKRVFAPRDCAALNRRP
jgi:hypothetical protein